MSEGHRAAIQREFERAGDAFARRTAHRFDRLGVVEFARARPGESVLEVGAGTGNFLARFAGVAGSLLAVDLTPGMLRIARERHPGLAVAAGDGARLPLASRSIDLVTSAQTLHHVFRPVDFLKEMRRVAADTGRVLVVDQVATERHEEAVMMTALELVRDPTHAASRPPSALRVAVQAAGLRIVDERVVEDEMRFSQWMWPDEFPPERIDAVRAFVDRHGDETGMNFRPVGADYAFTRRRMMLLAVRA